MLTQLTRISQTHRRIVGAFLVNAAIVNKLLVDATTLAQVGFQIELTSCKGNGATFLNYADATATLENNVKQKLC